MNAMLPLLASQPTDRASNIVAAGRALLPHLSKGRALSRQLVSDTMSMMFDGTDADGAWLWRDAYEAIEAAIVLQVRRLGHQVGRVEDAPADVAALLDSISANTLTHTRRSEEQIALDQFSTPPAIAALMAAAGQVRPGDFACEPSAGTGLIAIMAEVCGAKIALNEIGETRAGILDALFPEAGRTRHDALHLKDLLPSAGAFDVVLTNPPFTDIAKHLRAALALAADAGRMVALVPRGTLEDVNVLAAIGGQVLARIALPQNAFAKHGTSVDTGLVVVDRHASTDMPAIVECDSFADVAAAIADLPPRTKAQARTFRQVAAASLLPDRLRAVSAPSRSSEFFASSAPVAYSVIPWSGEGRDIGIFQAYQLGRIAFGVSTPHPTPLVESAAMAAVAPPAPTYVPHLPPSLQEKGMISDAQLEAIVYAGEAHSQFLPGQWKLHPETHDLVWADAADPEAFKVRAGLFLGDGTGVGKGTSGSGVVADNFCQGRDRAVWITLNDPLIEDARRDWARVGGAPSDIIPLANFAQGRRLAFKRGILFVTYGTLRQPARGAKSSRLDQIVEALGADFDGVILIDESHKLANSEPGADEGRGPKAASQQGRAGVALQNRLPSARVVYQSATGATNARNLAYASRLGLWGGPDAPFNSRDDFLTAIEGGGMAALELVARDLKSMGRYFARSLSFDGVEYDALRHDFTESDIEIWNSWADSFQIIHTNLEAALEATGSAGEGITGRAAGQAKSAARSAFESNKQRFFSALLSGLKAPALISEIRNNVLPAGDCAVVQLVSTNEAVLNRRLTDIPPEEWSNLSVDLTPKDYVLGYLRHAFPTIAMQEVRDDNGDLIELVPVKDENGAPVHSQEALRLRDELIVSLACLPAVPSVLDSLLDAFGADSVAEVTGRSRRVVLRNGRRVLERRPSSSNRTEAASFQAGDKNILVFSDAGGTGRSYHACLNSAGHKRRRHAFLVEPGWRADNALQGLGRTHRSNQASAPVFRPLTSNLPGEARFLSTICRRLDTLGAITRGERRSAGNGLFRPEDNLESNWARHALIVFYERLVDGKAKSMGLDEFLEKTALRLLDEDGHLRDKKDLPPIHTFLNRILALRVADQGAIFEEFHELLGGVLANAAAKGKLDRGIEDIDANNVELIDDTLLRTDPQSGAETRLVTFEVRTPRHRWTREHVLDWTNPAARRFCLNSKGHAAVVEAGHSLVEETTVTPAVKIFRPQGAETISASLFESTTWAACTEDAWLTAWDAQYDTMDPFETRRLSLVTGTLLPIWKRIPGGMTWVRRIKAPDGRRWLGRVVDQADLARLRLNLGLTDVATVCETPEDVANMLLKDVATVDLANGMNLRRARVMDQYRIEVVGCDAHRTDLKQLGCFIEIISFSPRVFIPAGSPEILREVLKRFPPTAIHRHQIAA